MKTNALLRYALIGVSALIFVTTILTRCTSETPAVESESPSVRAPAEVSVAVPPFADPGLALLRHPQTRERVVSFFTAEARNPDIAWAILTEADAKDIPVALAFSLAWAESRYQPRALNRNSSSVDRGLFQLNSETFPFLEVEEFYDPLINAKYGLSHLRFCLDEGGNEIVGLAMYNAGTQGVKRGTPLTTLQYVAAIIEYRADLEQRFADELVRHTPEGTLVVLLDS